VVARLITLRRSEVCCVCGSTVEPATPAWWSAGARTVTCVSCFAIERRGERIAGVIQSDHGDPPDRAPPIDPASPSGSARLDYQRRRRAREQRLDATRRRLARVVELLSDDPQRSGSWRKWSPGERRLAEHLGRELKGRAVVLHARRARGARGSIDHIVIAPTGVWVVDAKSYRGRVERRDVGDWLRTDVRLYVGGRDRSKSLAGLGWQAQAVRTALGADGLDVVPVHPVLCFTDSEWGWIAKAMRFDVVWVTWAQRLVEMIRAPGPIDAGTVERVALRLSAALPAT
jgi:hypothetical protein